MTFKMKAAVAAATMMTAALLSGTAMAEPKVLMLHQWASGNDAASIAKLGEMFTAKGGTWEQTAIAGHTANTLAKLRADVVAGNAPAAENASFEMTLACDPSPAKRQHRNFSQPAKQSG